MGVEGGAVEERNGGFRVGVGGIITKTMLSLVAPECSLRTVLCSLLGEWR